MARIHGRKGYLLADTGSTAGAAAAVPVTFISDWTVNGTRDTVDVTALGDTTKVKLQGLADAAGVFNGFLETSNVDLFNLSDGNSRGMYLYIDYTDSNTKKPVSGGGAGYFYGTASFDISSSGGVNDAAKVTLNWTATTSLSRV